MTTYYKCSKCGMIVESGEPEMTVWLIGPRKNRPGEMIIRCPKHATKYAARQIDPMHRSAFAHNLATR